MDQQLDNFSDDEDVIPEGSPLYQYLQECGLQVNDTSVKSFSKISIFSKVCALKKTIIQYLSNMNWKSDQKSLRLIIGVHVLKTLTIKDIFVQSDHMLLIQGTENISLQSITQPSLKWRNFSILGALISAWSISTKLLKKNSIYINCSLVGLGLLGIDMSQWLAQQMEPNFLTELEEICKKIKVISSYCKKCIQYIQEFKMLNLNSTLAMQLDILKKFPHIKSKLSGGSSSIFKRNMYLLMKEIFLTFQDKTTKLRDAIPIIDTYDLNSFYLSHIPLEEFNLGFDIDPINNKEHFEEFVDSNVNYRTFFNLMGEQISEYFRRLSFCFLIDMPASKSQSVVRIMKICQSQISSLENESAKWIKQIKDLYELHVSPENQLPIVPRSKSADSLLHSSLYILYAHLRNISLSVYDAHNVAHETEDLGAIYSLMECTKNEIDAIKEDIDHVFSYLPRPKQNAKSICKDEKELKALPQPTDDLPQVEQTFKEHVIVDEVFLGYSEPQVESEERDTEVQYEDHIPQKHTSKYLLLELNKVLKVKAKEHSEREAIAIAKCQGSYETPNTSIEDSNSSKEFYSTKYSSEEEEEEEVSDTCLKYPSISNKYHKNYINSSENESSIEETTPRPVFQLSDAQNSFSASISSMAAQYQQRFNLQTEVFADSDSDEDNISN